MANSADFIDHVKELLARMGSVTIKRMFGGHGVYLDGLFMAIIDDDELYLKADDITSGRFEAESCAPFTFVKQGQEMVTHYRRAPNDAMDAPHLMQPWARLAIEAAQRARASKPAPKLEVAARSKVKRKAKPASVATKARSRR